MNGYIEDSAELQGLLTEEVRNDKRLYQGKTREQWIRETSVGVNNPFSVDFSKAFTEIANTTIYKNYGVEKNGYYYPKDYRTYISHPTFDGIEPLVKDLNFNLAKLALNLIKKHSKEDFIKFTSDFMRLKGDIDLYYLLSKILHLKQTCQFQVPTEVSTDALFCESSQITHTSHIPWFSHKAIEFFFEDLNLPTFLVYRGSFRSLLNEFNIPNREVGESDDDAIHFFAETPSLGTVLFSVDNTNLHHLFSKNYDELISLGNSEVGGGMTINTKQSTDFTSEEIPHLVSAVLSCLKSMIYANSDPLRIEYNVPISSLKSGKRGVKGRPTGQVNKIIYLPKVRYKKGNSPNNESGDKRAFFGRLPYYRIYKDDKFVNMEKGKKYWYDKVFGTNGEDPVEAVNTTYIARKLKTPFKIKS